MEVTARTPVRQVKRSREVETADDTSTKRPRAADDTQKRPRTALLGRRHVKYQRYAKPPYTYLGMAAMAIETSPERKLTLAGIQEALCEMFPFFRGEYQGWRDSVRHNLSHNPCFVKAGRRQSGKAVNGCFWVVDLTLVSADDFKRTRVSKEQVGKWAPTLWEQLQLPEIQLPPPRTPPQKTWSGGRRHALDSAPSPSLVYTEAQYTRYLRQQSSDGSDAVPLSELPAFASLLYDNTTSDFTSAADNLHRLCPAMEYDTPVRIKEEHDFRQLCGKEASCPEAFLSSAVRDQANVRVEDTPSSFVAPSNEDPFQRYFSNLSSMVVQDSLSHLDLASEDQQTSHQLQSMYEIVSPVCRLSQTSCESTVSVAPLTDCSDIISYMPESPSHLGEPRFNKPSYEVPIAPLSNCSTISCVSDSQTLSAHLVKSEADRFTNMNYPSCDFPLAPPSDCSTISYVSESSQMSSSSYSSTISRRSTAFDFSTASFSDTQESSLSDIFEWLH